MSCYRNAPLTVILSERMRVEALRSAGGAKPRNEVTKGSSKDYSQPILLLLFPTEERDPSASLRMTEMSCFKLLTMAKQLQSRTPSPSPDFVGSSLPEGAFSFVQIANNFFYMRFISSFSLSLNQIRHIIQFRYNTLSIYIFQ